MTNEIEHGHVVCEGQERANEIENVCVENGPSMTRSQTTKTMKKTRTTTRMKMTKMTKISMWISFVSPLVDQEDSLTDDRVVL
jgi:hypothetical protein